MATPRSTSLRALRLPRQHSSIPALRRGLHITGSNSAQPIKSADRTSLYVSYSVTDLQSECQKRSLRSSGSKSEVRTHEHPDICRRILTGMPIQLIERLSNHDVLQSRAFSIALRRINSINGNGSATRNFNTSRSEKAVNDTSPVDFVYMPSMHDLEAPVFNPGPRVPVLPEIPSSAIKYTGQIPPAEEETADQAMKPQVYTVGGAGPDISASPMSEVVDNHAVEIDPFSLTEAVGQSRFGEELARENSKHTSAKGSKGIVGELWDGMMDDLLGSKPGQGQGRK